MTVEPAEEVETQKPEAPITDGPENALSADELPPPTGAEVTDLEEPPEPPSDEDKVDDLLEPGDEEYGEKVRKRIAKSTAKQREAERAAAEAAKSAEYWRLKALEKEQETQAQSPESPVAPKEGDFESYEDYQAALIEYRAELLYNKKRAQEREAEQKQREAEQFRAFDEKLRSGYEKYDDFDRVFKAPAEGGPLITEEMRVTLMRTDNPADIAMYLTKNPMTARKLASMHPLDMAHELLKMDAGLATGDLKPKPPKLPGAGPPIPAVVGGGSTGGPVNPDDLPINEWMRLSKEKKLKYPK